MLRSRKSIFLGMAFILIISFILPGCYTQLSRPRVDTEDEYFEKSEYEEVEEYYQDEGTLPAEDTRDVNIYNYYYPYWDGYVDYWDWYYSPYHWGYLGPYPHHWWYPYHHWWTPGWYVGFYYYDSWWSGYPGYYNTYYYSNNAPVKYYSKRPFSRRSARTVGRDSRTSTEDIMTVSKPQGPTRIERTDGNLTVPRDQERVVIPDKKQRSYEKIAKQIRSRTNNPRIVDDALPAKGTKRPTTEQKPVIKKPATKPSKIIDEARGRTVSKPKSTPGQPAKIKNPPRSSKAESKPKMINRAPSRKKVSSSKKSDASSRKSSSPSYKPSSRSSSPQVSRPAPSSYTPRSSGATRSTTRSSSSTSRSGSGSSRSSSKSGKK